MAETIKVPVFGTVKTKTAAAVAGISVVGVLAIWYFRQRSASQAASAQAGSSAAAGMVTDPAGNTCSASDVNPSTGFCSGTAADLSAQEQLQLGGLGGSGGLAGLSTGVSPVATTTTFANNAAWAQAAEQFLGSNGADAIAAALSKYLLGQEITTSQQTIVEEAIAAENYPPVAGPNGYPPAMQVTAAPAGSGGGSGSSPAGPVTGLKVTGVTANSVSLAWDPYPGVAGGGGYYVVNYTHINAQGGLVNVGPVLTTDATKITASGLASKASYIFYVQAATGGGNYASSSVLTPAVTVNATTS